MAKCRYCGASILWIKTTPKGKWMCVDEGLKPYKETKSGKDIVVTDRGETVRCNLEFEGWPTGMARTPHWATCPGAEQARADKKAQAE